MLSIKVGAHSKLGCQCADTIGDVPASTQPWRFQTTYVGQWTGCDPQSKVCSVPGLQHLLAISLRPGSWLGCDSSPICRCQWYTVCLVLVHCCFNRSWKSSIGITIAIMKKKNRQNNSVTNTNTYWLFCPFFVGWLPTYMFPFQPQLHLQINHWWMTR